MTRHGVIDFQDEGVPAIRQDIWTYPTGRGAAMRPSPSKRTR
jgi:hypothetical protein